MNRRTFLKMAGMGSLSIAAGCTANPEKTIYSLVHAPDDMVTGKATWYASTCRECPAGCGILAKNREGRVIKVEGNPLHPISRGKLCMRGQAALQGIYNPDRIRAPLLKENGKWRALSFSGAITLLKTKAAESAQKGSNRIRMLTEVVGETLRQLFTESLAQWDCQAPLVFEPYAYESLKQANQAIFGVDGLASYRLEQADLLVSFGADFLETWLSPVEYARKFKEMHALRDGRKGLFFHVSPYQSLTGANADLWLACKPGSEALIALCLTEEALHLGKGGGLSESMRSSIQKAVASYTREKVLKISGVAPEHYEKLLTSLIHSLKPLILGTGNAGTHANALQTDTAANLLNLVLDPDLTRLDFDRRHRVEMASRRSEVLDFFKALQSDTDLLLLNNTNPVFALPPGSAVQATLANDSLFVVSFSNFMDETTRLADLIIPTRLPLESWDEYAGTAGILSTLQPAIGKLTDTLNIGDVFLRSAILSENRAKNYKEHLFSNLQDNEKIRTESDRTQAFRQGGAFARARQSLPSTAPVKMDRLPEMPRRSLATLPKLAETVSGDGQLVLIAAPSIRFFDGRGANKPWLNEIPEPLSRIAWQTPVWVHPQTLAQNGIHQGDIVMITSEWGSLEAPVYATDSVKTDVLLMGTGQGHTAYGRYAQGMGVNPLAILSPEPDPVSRGPRNSIATMPLQPTGRTMQLANTDGSRITHGRKIALTTTMRELEHGKPHPSKGLAMYEFPFALPLPEGYDPKRDFYPPHEHDGYRWSMVVDMDRCIGCGACAAACYAENNVGVVGEKRVIEGREMAWLSIERYLDPRNTTQMIFLPMLCQHCDNAPCEGVCPVYAPHHSKEGINNQIYNRCIGTRFCVQNCPYKVRRFNWFTWEWPTPLNLQLNPDVTVRSKGVMEKCSFCIHRLKEAHTMAKNAGRKIRDGEVTPACVETCPTDALVFGNLMDVNSRVRKMIADARAYQVMGYLNTKPAVIYLKKVIQEI